MDDRDGSTTTPLDRLRSRFGDSNGSTDDDDSSEESAWQRYAAVLQMLFVVGAAFGGAIVSFASTTIDRTANLAQESGPALLDTLWPVLVGVTLLAVVICVVVVGLGMRNV